MKQEFVYNSASFNPLPVEAPINAKMTREAIEHILPSTNDLVQTTPVNEIFHEEPTSFHTMDTQIERALLSTFISDEKEMEKALSTSTGVPHHRDFADALMEIVNEEPVPHHHMATGSSFTYGGETPLPFASGPALNSTFPASAPGTTNYSEIPSISALATGAVAEFNFPRKVYRMLDDAEQNPSYQAIVSWAEEGMAFKVHNKKLFVDNILPIYFDMTQYASFRRQLNMYSFERKHTSTYSNPYFVRGCPDLLEKITRKSGSNSNKGSKK
jgi:hypothetical protein